MKYISKIFSGPGFIILGVLVGGYIGIADGSGPIVGVLGGMLGGILYYVINWSRSRRTSGLGSDYNDLDEPHSVNSSVQKQEINTVVRKVRDEALLDISNLRYPHR